MVNAIFTSLVLPAPTSYRSYLRRFAALTVKEAADVALRAQQLLVRLVWVLLFKCVFLVLQRRIDRKSNAVAWRYRGRRWPRQCMPVAPYTTKYLRTVFDSQPIAATSVLSLPA